MSLLDVIGAGRAASKRERAGVPRQARLLMALREVNREIRILIFARPSGDAAQDAVDMEYHRAEDHREMLLRGEFPRAYSQYVVDGDYTCEECSGGHLPDCDALGAEDVYDCLWKSCKGCCPNGCPEHGLAREATIQGEKLAKALRLGADTPRYDIHEALAMNADGALGPKCSECDGNGSFFLGPDSASAGCESCGGTGVAPEALEEDESPY